MIPWRFQEDFHPGISGWTSFPLPQDVGWDPTIYPVTLEGSPALMRNVISRGESSIRVGLLRQLHFLAMSDSAFEVTYGLEMGGTITGAWFTVAGQDGKKYETTLPFEPGEHTVRISGAQLHLPAPGTAMEAVVIEAKVSKPLLGSGSRLTIRSLAIQSRELAPVVFRSPSIAYSSGSGAAVSTEVVTPQKSPEIELAPPGADSLEILDGSGEVVTEESIARGADRVSVPERIREQPGLWTARLASGPKSSEFQFLVLGNLPPHPRVLLTSDRLQQLKADPNANELANTVHERAAKLAASIAMNPKAGDNIAQLSGITPFPSIVQYFTLMENYSNAIGYNAVDYRLTGNRRSLEVARQALLVMAKWTTWTHPWWPAHGLDTYYEVGVAVQRIAFGYDLIVDELTAEERSAVVAAFWRNAIEPTVRNYFLKNRIPTEASNHEANSVGGAIAAIVAVYGDVPEWNDRLGGALAELAAQNERLLSGLFPGEGDEAEPAGYQNFAMEGLSWGLASLHALGIHPKGADNMAQSFEWLRYVQVHPGIFLDTGDTDGEIKALSGFAWSAEFSGNPGMRKFYDSATEQSVSGLVRLPSSAASNPVIADTGRALEEAPGLLDLACCSRPDPPKSTFLPPPSRLFPKRGCAALRSGWGPEDTVVSIRVGPWFNHEHHDQGSFQVAAFGETLVGEAGYTDYYRDPNYGDYFSEAPGHNTVLINENPFSQTSYDGRYWNAFENYPRITKSIFSSGINYLDADLAPAYGGKLRTFHREYLFLKPNVLIIHDRLQSETPQRYDWLLHVPTGLTVTHNGSDALIRGTSAAAVITVASPDLRWSVESTPIPNSEYANLDTHQILPRQQIKLVSPEQTHVDFLVGMRFTDKSPESAALSPVATTSAEGFATTMENTRTSALFRLHDGPLASGDFMTDGNILAVLEKTGSVQIFAGGAQSLRDKQQEVFQSGAPVNLVLRTTPDDDDLEVFADRPCLLKILARKAPVDVRLDGKRLEASPSGGYVLLNVTAGEHSASIQY
jgi:hypothetical protein